MATKINEQMLWSALWMHHQGWHRRAEELMFLLIRRTIKEDPPSGQAQVTEASPKGVGKQYEW